MDRFAVLTCLCGRLTHSTQTHTWFVSGWTETLDSLPTHKIILQISSVLTFGGRCLGDFYGGSCFEDFGLVVKR